MWICRHELNTGEFQERERESYVLLSKYGHGNLGYIYLSVSFFYLWDFLCKRVKHLWAVSAYVCCFLVFSLSLALSLSLSLSLTFDRCEICWRVYRFTLYLENRSGILISNCDKDRTFWWKRLFWRDHQAFIYWLYRDLNLCDEKMLERKVTNEQKHAGFRLPVTLSGFDWLLEFIVPL